MKMNYFLSYVKKVILQWITLLGFIPFIYDYLQAYFPEPLQSYKIPPLIVYAFLPIVFIYASYKVWLEEKIKIEELQKDTSTVFSVKSRVYKLSVKEHIQNIDKEIAELEEKRDKIPDLPEPLKNMASISRIFTGEADRDTYTEWINSLKKYKSEVLSFYKKYKQLLSLNFSISVSQYDENIDIATIIKSKSKFFRTAYDLDYPFYPIKKTQSLLSGFSMPLSTSLADKTPPFRTRTAIDDKGAFCTLREIKKDEEISFWHEGILVDGNEEKIEIEVRINSRNSNGEKKYPLAIERSDVKKFVETTEIDAFNKFMS